MNKIQLEFNNLIGELSDEQFWVYIKTWFDEQIILDIMNEWNDDIKEEEIKNLKKILHK